MVYFFAVGFKRFQTAFSFGHYFEYLFYRRVMLPSGETSSPFPLGKSLRFR